MSSPNHLRCLMLIFYYQEDYKQPPQYKGTDIFPSETRTHIVCVKGGVPRTDADMWKRPNTCMMMIEEDNDVLGEADPG